MSAVQGPLIRLILTVTHLGIEGVLRVVVLSPQIPRSEVSGLRSLLSENLDPLNGA